MARIKECFTSSEIAHIWANQSHATGRVSGGNKSFNGKLFYSYSTCVAQIVTAPNGQKVYLLSAERFSNTTAGHLSELRRAISSDYIFEYPYNSRYRGSYTLASGSQEEIGTNLYNHYTALASESLEKSKRARENKGHLISCVAFYKNEVNRIIDLWNLPLEKTTQAELDELSATANALIEIANKKRNDRWNNRAELERIKREKRVAKLKLELEKWRNGEAVQVDLYELPTALRVCPSNNSVIETSRGARITTATAKRLFPFAMARRATGWHRNGESFKLDNYQLDQINESGIQAGCHFIEWVEIERMAEVLGLV